MPKGVARGRKLIAVPSELVSELNELANRDGVPFYSYTTEALEHVVKAGRMGRKLREILDFYEVMEVRKVSGHVIVPQETLNWLIKKLYSKEKENLQEVWRHAGRWFGRLLNAKFGSGAFDFFIKILKLSGWELGEVVLEQNANVVSLRLTSFTLSEENTFLLMCYLEGVMESLGVKIENKEHMRGVIKVEFKKNA